MLDAPLPMLIVVGFGLGTLYLTTQIKDTHKTVAMECLEDNYDRVKSSDSDEEQKETSEGRKSFVP